jgi:hypothetical protein
MAAADSARTRDMQDVAQTIQDAALAYGTETDRAAVIEAAITLIRDLVDAARAFGSQPTAAEAWPIVAFDPFAPLPTVRARRSLSARPNRRRHEAARADSSVLEGHCMDDLLCLPP